ncbi:MAG: acyl carrier protein [Clostridia bacterium]|nr:acyl carrier protein [Clostridia bacterium]
MDELLKILNNVKPGVDFEHEENIMEDEIIDSFDIVTLVSMINDEFDIEITPADLVPENFKSAKTIYNMIERLQNEV